MTAPPPRRREPGELAFACIVLLASLFLFSQAYQIAGFSSVSSAGVFPLIATGLMIVTLLLTIARTLRMDAAVEPGSSLTAAFRRKVVPPDFVVFTGLTVLYALALDPLGFPLSSFLFLTLAIFYLHGRRIVLAVAISVLALTAIYLVFRIAFAVVLPKGWVFG